MLVGVVLVVLLHAVRVVGGVVGGVTCSCKKVSRSRQALNCNFIWDLILGVFPLDARHLGRDPSPLEEQGLGRDPSPLEMRGLGLPISQFREPVALKRARITAPLGFLDRDSSMSDEPSLSPESFDFSSCRLAIGSRPFLTGIPCGDATRAGSTTPKSGTENAAPAERCVEGCLLRRWRPPPASAHIAIQKNNGQADQRQLCSVNAHGTENGVSRHFIAEQQ